MALDSSFGFDIPDQPGVPQPSPFAPQTASGGSTTPGPGQGDQDAYGQVEPQVASNAPPTNEPPDLITPAAAKYNVPYHVLYNTINAESGGRPGAVSPTGATGVAQFTGATAKQYGVDRTNVGSSIDGAAHYLSDLRDKTGSWTAALGAYSGQGPGLEGYSKYGSGQRLVQAARDADAQEAAATQPAAKDTTDYKGLLDVMGPPSPGAQPLPPGVSSPAVTGSAGYYGDLVKVMDANNAPTQQMGPTGLPPSPSVMQDLAHAATYLPAMTWRAIAAGLGWRNDLLNLETGAQNWVTGTLGATGQAPPLGGENPPGQPGFGQAALNILERPTSNNFATLGGALNAPGTVPAAPSTPGEAPPTDLGGNPTAPPLAQGLAAFPALPSEVGDPDTIAKYLETFGEPAMQVAGGGIPKTIAVATQAGKFGLGKAARSFGANAAIGASVFGIGNEIGEGLAGSEGGPSESQAVGVAASGLMEALRLGIFKGGSAAFHSAAAAPSWVQSIFRGKIGPAANIQKNLLNPALASATFKANNPEGVMPPNKEFGSASGGPIPGTVPGFEMPAATQTGDPRAQAMMLAHVKSQNVAAGRYDEVLQNNAAAIQNAAEGIIPGTGESQDVIDFFTKQLENDRQQMTDHVNDLGQAAEADYNAAVRDSGKSPSHLDNQVALGTAGFNAVWQADKDLKAYSDWRWDQARADGIDEVSLDDNAAQDHLFGPLQALAADAVRSGQTEHFPWSDVNQLYRGRLQDMLDEDGNLKQVPKGPAIDTGLLDASGEPISRAGPGGTPMGSPRQGLKFGQVREIGSDLEASIRQERKAVTSPMIAGDPKSLRWQSAVAQVLNNSMDNALEAAGPDNLASYRLATAATSQYYQLMHQGVIGQVLGRNLQGGAASILAPQTLHQLVPGGLNGAATTMQLFKAIDTQNDVLRQMGAPTPHPADMLNNLVQQHLRLEFGQALRTSPVAGQKFIDNNTTALQAYPQVRQEFDNAVRSGQAHQQIADPNFQSAYDREQGERDASLFLGGKAGQEIDYITRSKNPVAAMNSALDSTAADTTGNASRGLARMMFNRLRTEAVNPDGTYSPGGVAKFWNQYSGVYAAMGQRGLLDYGNLTKIINSFRGVDQILSGTPEMGMAVSPLTSLSLAAFGRVGAGVAGAMIGRHMETGTIQVPGIMASTAREMYDATFQAITGKPAQDLQCQMLFDPKLMNQVLNPQGATLAQKATSLHKTLAPYYAAVPAIAALQANKAPQPQNSWNKTPGGGLTPGSSDTPLGGSFPWSQGAHGPMTPKPSNPQTGLPQ